MIAYNENINKEIISLIKSCTGDKIPIYNSAMLVKPPKEEERIEFKLANFVSTGQIYKMKDINGDGYSDITVSEYRCQLSIRIFEDVVNCPIISANISGAIQTFGYLEQFVSELYIKNETMRILPFIIQKDNLVVNFQEIIVDCYIGIEFKGIVDFFDKIEDSYYEIN